jgi:hypothetical protein
MSCFKCPLALWSKLAKRTMQRKLLIRASDLTSLLRIKHSKTLLASFTHICCPSKSHVLCKCLIQPTEEAGLFEWTCCHANRRQRHFQRQAERLAACIYWFLAFHILWPWRWKWNFPLKHQAFSELHDCYKPEVCSALYSYHYENFRPSITKSLSDQRPLHDITFLIGCYCIWSYYILF